MICADFVPVTLVDIEVAIWMAGPSTQDLRESDLKGQPASHLDNASGALLCRDDAICS